MYTRHYGLREKPFSLSPDPRYLFLSASHREALAHLLYGIESGEGFIAVTGEVGTGKTTLCRTLLERIGPDAEVAYLFNPRLTGLELLQAVHRELALPGEGSRAELLDALLDSPELRQLRQRIGVRWRLDSLSEPEAIDYVRHRLRIAAGNETELFTPAALRELRRRSRGVPRLVNLLADRALLAGYADGSLRVERTHVGRAAREILRARERRRGRTRPRWKMFAGKRSD